MALVLNNIKFDYDEEQPLQPMDIHSFVNMFEYDIDKLYIDRFWNNLDNDEWIIIDYDMLRWMGYNYARDRSNKETYIKLLSNNFTLKTDYDIVSNENIDEVQKRLINTALKNNTVIVSVETFKDSLMLLRTQKAKDIRGYYKTLERIFKDYERYTHFINKHNDSIEIKRLTSEVETESIPAFDIDKSPMKLTEYCYIMTSERYFRRNTFKVGKSINPKSRLITHNCTQATDEDQMFYTHVIATFDCSGLEKILHKALSRYHTHKEWFMVPHEQLKYIIQLVISQQNMLLQQINESLQTESFEMLSLQDFMNISTSQPHLLHSCNTNPSITIESPNDTLPSAIPMTTDSHSCQLCNTHMMIDPDSGDMACPVCRDVPEHIKLLFYNQSKPSFNSKYNNLMTLIHDSQYCSWLLAQFWFSQTPEFQLINKLYIPLYTPRKHRYSKFRSSNAYRHPLS